MPTPTLPSLLSEEKCNKNKDNNNHFRIRETCRDIPLQNCQQPRTLPKKRRKKQSITRHDDPVISCLPEIAEKCRRYVAQCEEALAMMNELLRTSRIENFWLRWNLQEMGPSVSQSEYNATVMPMSMGTRPISQVTTAAGTPSQYEPGNVTSTTPSTATARLHSSPPMHVRTPGLTSCQASRLHDKPRRRPDRFIRSQIVGRETPIVRTSLLSDTAMLTPMRSSFSGSSNSSSQNYARRLPAVRMARTKQTARKDRDDQHRGWSQQEGDRRRDRSPTPPKRVRPRSPSPEHLECAFCGQVN